MKSKNLSHLEYCVTQLGDTEPPFSHPGFPDKDGKFYCVCCESTLFSSSTKFESGSGWPSFYEPITAECLQTRVDHSHGMKRVEVVCNNCKAHLGHVFEDGPKPTGLRYCINGVALRFKDD